MHLFNNICTAVLVISLPYLVMCSSSKVNHDTPERNIRSILKSNLRMESYYGISGDVSYFEQQWPRFERDKSGGVTKKCMEYLKHFSNTTTNFLKCVMTNARPLHYCENCVGEYSATVNAYEIISKSDVQNDTTCEEELLQADNVQVVLLAYNFVQDVWEKSTCHNCYYSVTVNDTVIYHATNATLDMLKKIQDTQGCFRDLHNNDIPIPGQHGNLSVCYMCKEFYCVANSYYNELDDENKLCSDLKDSMNYTRRMWSKDFHCTVAVRSDKAIYSISALIACLPLLLYLGVWFYGNHVARRTRRLSEVSSPTSPMSASLREN